MALFVEVSAFFLKEVITLVKDITPTEIMEHSVIWLCTLPHLML